MGAKRVLLVDDDVDFLEINRLTLEKAGFEVVTADNGDEGFRVATSTPVDVAVLDVMMDTPTEGFELARRLRAARADEAHPAADADVGQHGERGHRVVRPLLRSRPRQGLAAGGSLRRQADQAGGPRLARPHARRRVDLLAASDDDERAWRRPRPGEHVRRRSLVEQELVNSLGWLISLRWLAGAGVLGARRRRDARAGRAAARPAALSAVGVAILAYNAALWWQLGRLRPGAPGRHRRVRDVRPRADRPRLGGDDRAHRALGRRREPGDHLLPVPHHHRVAAAAAPSRVPLRLDRAGDGRRPSPRSSTRACCRTSRSSSRRATATRSSSARCWCSSPPACYVMAYCCMSIAHAAAPARARAGRPLRRRARRHLDPRDHRRPRPHRRGGRARPRLPRGGDPPARPRAVAGRVRGELGAERDLPGRGARGVREVDARPGHAARRRRPRARTSSATRACGTRSW